MCAAVMDGTTMTLRRDDMLVVDVDFVNVLQTEVIRPETHQSAGLLT